MDFPGLSGITNLGNTCYMNSVLQCLSATDLLNHYLRSIYFKINLREGVKRLYIDKLRKKNRIIELSHNVMKSKFKDSVTYRLYQLMSIMWNCRSSTTPKYFKSSFDSHCKTFKGYQQHDAQEFLLTLLDRMHDELKTDIEIDKYNFNDDYVKYIQYKVELFSQLNNPNLPEQQKQIIQQQINNLIQQNINKEIYLNGIDKKIDFLKKNHSIISDLFLGMYLNQIICSECKYNSFSYEPFNILTLEICDNNLSMFNNLQECLNNFLKPELVDYTCEQCKNKSKSQKIISIFSLPEKLIIQFKRFKFINGRSAKINSLIDFPLDNVDFKQFENNIHPPYELYGIVHHSGGTNGGHYVATTKNPINFKWYEFNDSNLQEINNPNRIIDRTAYILFYQRKRLTEPIFKEAEISNVVDINSLIADADNIIPMSTESDSKLDLENLDLDEDNLR